MERRHDARPAKHLWSSKKVSPTQGWLTTMLVLQDQRMLVRQVLVWQVVLAEQPCCRESGNVAWRGGIRIVLPHDSGAQKVSLIRDWLISMLVLQDQLDACETGACVAGCSCRAAVSLRIWESCLERRHEDLLAKQFGSSKKASPF